MKRNLPRILEWIGASEGGYVNDPKDPGGPTNHGVTQRIYDAYRKRVGREPLDVQRISRAEVEAIFSGQYFDAVRGADLPDGLDYTMVDFAVNSGPARAIRELQSALGVVSDGVMGLHTMAALADGRDIEALIIRVNTRRMAFLKRLRTWPRFGRGWTRRVEGKKWGAQTDDIGVIDRSIMLCTRHSSIPAPIQQAPEKGSGPQNLWVSLINAIARIFNA